MSVLRDSYQLIQGGGLKIAVAATEATTAVKVGTVYVLTCNTDCYIRFSGSAVTASAGAYDLFMPSGTSAILMATNGTLRAIRDSADGTLGVAEVEIA
jgi:hypothetical protein